MEIRKKVVTLQWVKELNPTAPAGSGLKQTVMKKVYIFDVFTKKDITAVVTLAIGKGGIVHVFNSFGIDITENVFFGLE